MSSGGCRRWLRLCSMIENQSSQRVASHLPSRPLQESRGPRKYPDSFRKIRAPIKIKSALPPPKKKPKYPPPKTRILWTWVFSCRKNEFFPGVHKIGAPISGPRIADKKFYGHEDFSESWRLPSRGRTVPTKRFNEMPPSFSSF